MKKDLINAIAELEENKSLNLVKKQIDNGATPLGIVEQCRKGVEIVGKKYSNGEYFLSDLVMSEEILKGIIDIISPFFPDNENEDEDIDIVIGTIEGDIHDLGKNIVIYLLRSAGINVLDLGVDVKAKEFLEAIKKTEAPLLGISVLLTFSIGYVKKAIELFEEEGLRDELIILIGGYPVNKEIQKFTGADYFELDADKAVELIKKLK